MSNWDFALAIDIGNSHVVSAVARITQSAQTETMVFSTGDDEHSMASAVFVNADGSLHFADEAERLGAEHPERLVREFANRIGDEVPVMVGEHAIPAEDLYASMCAWIVREVTASEEASPSVIAVTVPTGWGGHRRALVAAALERAGIADVILLSEAEAAARHYEVSNPLEPGQMIGVYDLGGTTFNALVLRKRIAVGVGSQPIGEQIGLDLGGADFDELLLRQVMTTADPTTLHTGGSAAIRAVTQLRREVVRAKETLSSEADATLSIESAAGRSTVRINRSEFEALIGDQLERTLDAFDLAVESAGIEEARLEAIVLTGGSSRIPLVAQRLSERFNRPIVAADDPRTTVALGAALIAGERVQNGLAPHSALVPVGDAAGEAGVAQITSLDAALDRGPKTARPAAQKSWWPKSPILLTTAAAFIAFAIVFSNTTAAGSRWPDYIQAMADEAAAVVDPLILRDFAAPDSESTDTNAEQAVSVEPNAPADRKAPSDRSTARERNATRDTALVSHRRGITPPDVSTDAPREATSNSTPRTTTKAPPKSSGPQPTTAAPADPMPAVDPDPVTTPTPDTPPPADPTPPADSTPPADTTPPADPAPADPPPSAPPEDPAPPAEPPADSTPASAETPADPAPADPVEPTP